MDRTSALLLYLTVSVEHVLGKVLHCDSLCPIAQETPPKNWLHLLHSPHLEFIHLDKILLSLLISRGLAVPAVSASPCLKMLQLLNHLHSLFTECLQHVHISLLLSRALNKYSSCGLTRAVQWGKGHLLYLLTTLLLRQGG